MSRASLIERAFQMADSGQCAGVVQIRKRLQAEGYAAHEIMGKSLIDDLGRRCRAATGKPEAKPAPPAPKTAEERAERSRKAAATRRANSPSLPFLKSISQTR